MMTIILTVGAGIVALFALLRVAITGITFKRKPPRAQPTPEERRIKLQFTKDQQSIRDARSEVDEQSRGATLGDIARDLNRRDDE